MQRYRCRTLLLATPVLLLAACGSVPQQSPEAGIAVPATQSAPPIRSTGTIPALPPAGSGRGGYYQDDGPGDAPPADLLDIPDAEPQIEAYSKHGNRPYVVFGKRYVPITDDRPYKARGVGSWYGKKFQGQKTSSGERYDMYKMTAAHPTLPIPSYARVTNLANGRQVIVRINDRGPFHAGRIIDLSYTAALKLGYLSSGSSRLEVERLLPDDIARLQTERKERLPHAEPAAEPLPVTPEKTPDTPAVTAATSTGMQSDATPKPVVLSPVSAAAADSLAPGFYLQFGAYGQADNAQAERSRLLQNRTSDMPSLQVVESGSLYRLYGGPFATRAEAMAAAQRVQDAGTPKPLVVQR
jgi:rare lipoprotein A